MRHPCRRLLFYSAVAVLAASCSGESAPTSTEADSDGATVTDPVRAPGAMPTPDTVGLRSGTELHDLPAADVEHGESYERVRVIGDIELGTGDVVRFEDCLIEGSIVTEAPVELERCDVLGGLYPYDVGGALRDVLIDSPGGQAFRPALWEHEGWERSTPWLVEDVYLRVPAGGEGDHVEAVQVLGGRDLVFRNVVFDTGCPFNNTQTADLSMNAADTLVEDSWFIGCGGYAIYSDGPGVRIVRPHIGSRHQWGILYTDPGSDRIDPVIIGPTDLEGRPLTR